MDAIFSDYIIFVDESGDHSLEVINPAYPLFVLAVGRYVLRPEQDNRAFDVVERKLMTDGKTGLHVLRRPRSRKKGYEGIGLKVFP